MSDNAGNNGTIETTIYRQVNFKKSEGSLTLTKEDITFNPFMGDCTEVTSTTKLSLSWSTIVKHQVSPATYPKALLKLTSTNAKLKTVTFQFYNREELERIRKDVTIRLREYRSSSPQQQRSNNGSTTTSNTAKTKTDKPATTTTTALSGKKRPHMELLRSYVLKNNNKDVSSVTELDDDALNVTRSSLLANNSSLRTQYEFLVEEAKTISIDDFWKTHESLLQEEYARICGMSRARGSSILQTPTMQGKVTLSVEEMRQIFIMYPAVHKAYEEKVPVELSDEEFWRKYLESEYFHRDNKPLEEKQNNNEKGASKSDQQSTTKQKKAVVGKENSSTTEESGVVGSTGGGSGLKKQQQQLGTTHLAVGQFDLASTFETERGDLLEGPRDNHPSDGKGARVIQKYNRHWAMVFHMDKAKNNGENLMDAARQSVHDVLENDDDAKTRGGIDKEMKQLVNLSMATDQNAAQAAAGLNLLADIAFQEISLNNLKKAPPASQLQEQHKELLEQMKDNKEAEEDDGDTTENYFEKCLTTMAQRIQAFETKQLDADDSSLSLHKCFPVTNLAVKVLSGITDKIAKDAKTNAEHLKKAKDLPDDFKKQLNFCFQRSSEMLRHFYGIRKLDNNSTVQHKKRRTRSNVNNNINSGKLQKIVSGMKTFYQEVEDMRKNLPNDTESGERMQKMCSPILEQLDWAFRLYQKEEEEVDR